MLWMGEPLHIVVPMELEEEVECEGEGKVKVGERIKVVPLPLPSWGETRDPILFDIGAMS
jgi:hypothetical protein